MNINDVFCLFKSKSIVISSRMHGIYIAGMCGVPCIGINVHPKVKDATCLFNRATSIEPTFQIEEVDAAISKVWNEEKRSAISNYHKSAIRDYKLVSKWIEQL